MNNSLKKILSIIPAKELKDCFDPPISVVAIGKWHKTGIPANRVLIIEAAVDAQVTRYEMRPDVFGQPPADESSRAA